MFKYRPVLVEVLAIGREARSMRRSRRAERLGVSCKSGMQVVDPGIAEGGCKRSLGETGLVTPRSFSHVDENVDPGFGEDYEEFLYRSLLVAESEEGIAHRGTISLMSPVDASE